MISHNSFSCTRNNGKTLESLFYCQPKGCLAQIYFHAGSDPDLEFCGNMWQLSDNDVLNSLFRTPDQIGHQVVEGSSPTVAFSYPSILREIKKRTGNVFRDMIWRLGHWESPELWAWLKSFSPDIVFFVGGDAFFSAKVALSISSSLSIPIAVYYTDDYLFSLQTKSLKGRIKRLRLERLFQTVVSKASAHFVIGDYMAKEYEKYFHRPFYPIMNSIPIRPYKEYPNRDELEIVYFGGLHLNRWRMIARLANLVPDNTIIKVYTSISGINEEIRSVFDSAGVLYCGSLSGDDLLAAMTSADILLHVESDDERNRRFTRLAISTKIPEYLITGRPVLGFGPTEVASMRILSDNEIGVVLDSDMSDLFISENIASVVSNYIYRRDVGKKGYDFAVTYCNREVISSEFLSKLTTIVNLES